MAWFLERHIACGPSDAFRHLAGWKDAGQAAASEPHILLSNKLYNGGMQQNPIQGTAKLGSGISHRLGELSCESRAQVCQDSR